MPQNAGPASAVVAGDLRFIVAALKINNDLERIGDLAVNVARKVSLSSQTPMEIPFNLAGMGEKTQEMLRDSLAALVNLDPKLANSVCPRRRSRSDETGDSHAPKK